jgi:hypothetical protein
VEQFYPAMARIGLQWPGLGRGQAGVPGERQRICQTVDERVLSEFHPLLGGGWGVKSSSVDFGP